MGYFAIAMNDAPSELISTIKANLELYKLVNKDTEYNYLLDMMQGDLEKLQNLHLDKEFNTRFNVDDFVKEALKVDIDDVKLCYSISELQDPKMFQESLDTLNNLDVNGFTGEVKLKNRSRRRLR